MLSLKVLERSLNLIIKLSGNSELESSLLKDFTVTGADPWGPAAPQYFGSRGSPHRFSSPMLRTVCLFNFHHRGLLNPDFKFIHKFTKTTTERWPRWTALSVDATVYHTAISTQHRATTHSVTASGGEVEHSTAARSRLPTDRINPIANSIYGADRQR